MNDVDFKDNYLRSCSEFVLCDMFLISKPTGPELKSYIKRQYAVCEEKLSCTLFYVKRTLESHKMYSDWIDDIVFTLDDLKKPIDDAVAIYVGCDGDIDCLSSSIKDSIDSIYNNYLKSEIEKSALYVPPVETNIERKKLSNKMRYNVLKRDGFRCCICGATSATTELVVDHIIPVSYGGKTVMSNLQTLCFECNNGKSDDFDFIKDESYV